MDSNRNRTGAVPVSEITLGYSLLIKIFSQGDLSDCMYIVMGGRLRAVEASKIVEEYGRLDVIGITDMAERKSRKSTVLAVRFSHLVSIPEKLLGFVKIRYPQVISVFDKNLGIDLELIIFFEYFLLPVFFTTPPFTYQLFSNQSHERFQKALEMLFDVKDDLLREII